eukprot:4077177-Pyramimonas_sp.AAC.1
MWFSPPGGDSGIDARDGPVPRAAAEGGGDAAVRAVAGGGVQQKLLPLRHARRRRHPDGARVTTKRV